METALLHPIVQFGFAGFCGVQFLILVWMMKALLAVVRESSTAITESTETMRHLNGKVDAGIALAQAAKDKLQARPCIAQREEGAR